MITDSIFQIGYSHTICEDYAISGKINDNVSFAIVADGCSSSMGVDVGARILSYSARQIFIQLYANNFTWNDLSLAGQLATLISIQADCLRRQMRLPLDILDSTLLVAIGDDYGNAHVFCYGDGIIALKKRNEEPCYYDIEYSSGAPYYLSYLLDDCKNDRYQETFRGLNEDIIIRNRNYISEEPLDSYEKYTATGKTLYDLTSMNFTDVEWIALMSDGVKTYKKTIYYEDKPSQLEGCGFDEIMTDLTRYKNFNGKFIKRKMNRLNKDHKKLGMIHYDDLSIAAIYFGMGKT